MYWAGGMLGQADIYSGENRGWCPVWLREPRFTSHQKSPIWSGGSREANVPNYPPHVNIQALVWYPRLSSFHFIFGLDLFKFESPFSL